MNLTNKIEVKEIPKIIEVVQPTISKVECNQETITAYLSDTRVITIPTGWYKVLREAKLEQLKNVKIMPAKKGIHWPDLEEFLSIKAFTQGLNAGC
jgi:hypothetical protein